jgi:hypothetical protein
MTTRRFWLFAVMAVAPALAVHPTRALSTRWSLSAQQPGQDLSFTRSVYPLFEAAQCSGCHNEDGVASATRLHFPDANASPDDVEAFGLSLATLVDRTDPARSLLLNKPTNRERHTGGVRIKPGSPEEQALTAWVQHLATVPEATVAAARERLAAAKTPTTAPQQLRRLTHSQYNNTVRDLLGDFSRPADRFPPEDFVNGFKNQLRTQGMPPLLTEVYGASAEKLAVNAFRAGDVNKLIPCTPTSANDVRCRDQFVRRFGLRAFRRPLSDDEAKRYIALFTAQASKANQFLDGARIVVEAMLQSPKFLFHAESGPGGRHRDYEIASRLSYFLWDTMPDQRLLDAAANGELRTPDGIERVARQMLEQPQARQALDEFFAQWLRFDRVLAGVKDRRRFPEFTPELAAMMVQETRMLLGSLVWKGGNFMDAFTADYGFLNADLATLYGVPAPTGEFELVKFPATARRAGILGQAAFLSSTAGPAETSPTARGIFIREQLLCQHVPNPPPGVNTEIPEPSAAKPLPMRQRMQVHMDSPLCSGCHRLMDPIGFGLENYDAVGRWRNAEVIEFGAGRGPGDRVELPIDGSGEIAGLTNSSFTEPTQIGTILARSQGCQECIVKQVFRYTFGRLETASDRETVRRAFGTFRESGFQFKELLVAMVRAPQFLSGLDDRAQSSVAAR